MKITIVSNVELPDNGINELASFGISPLVRMTNARLSSTLNPYFRSVWGDFNWIRSFFIEPSDVRVFVTSKQQLVEQGITGHIGMFDMADRDTTHDVYIGLPERLDKRAKRNQFKTNLAWLIIHEILHGEEKSIGGPDRTHAMEKEGRLIELWHEHEKRRALLKQQITLLQRLYQLLSIQV